MMCLFFLISGSAFAFAVFPDVPEDYPNFEAIEFLKAQGIINGYDDGKFGPEDSINRAQAIKIIDGAFGVAVEAEYEVLFPDVTKDQWFFPYVMAGQKGGLVNGYPDGKFRPEKELTLAESLKIIMLAAKVSLPKEVTSIVFSDVPQNEWYAKYALYARENNILSPDQFGKVYPDAPVSRADFSEIIYRTMKVKESGEAYPLNKTWKQYESTRLPFQIKYDDKNWLIVENKNETVFYKPDVEAHQSSPWKIYPNSAAVIVSLDKNLDGLSSFDYFKNIKATFAGASYTDFTWDGFKAMEVLYPLSRTADWYIYLNDGTVLNVYTSYGDGVQGFYLPKVIQNMLNSLKYHEVSVDIQYAELLSTIFSNILIEGKGMDMINLLPDKTVIETDAIGVGTGPVDYYYSAELNYTFKYERASDVILDKREGKTSSF